MGAELNVSVSAIPARALNHCRPESTSEISAIGASRTVEAISTTLSKRGSGSVSRIALLRRSRNRSVSFLGIGG
jgi:hypothetical protein